MLVHSSAAGARRLQNHRERFGFLLGRVCKGLQPEHDGADMEHSKVVLDAFLVSGGDAAKLFEAVDQALHSVARPIGLAVEAGSATLVALAGDHRTDAAPTQVVPRGLARKGLVGGQAPRPQPRAAALAADRAGIEQSRKLRAVVPLAAAQLEGDRLAIALGANVDLGREAAAGAAERLILNPLFSPLRRAPAAC